MKWTVALFGHEKPEFYVQDANTNTNLYSFVEDPGELPYGMKLHRCIGNARRAKPGDVIDSKPEKCWNCDENQYREIAQLLRNRSYLTNKKSEIKAKYVARSRGKDWRVEARFERLWRDRIRSHGLNDPALIPDEIITHFNKVRGSSLWHYRGENIWGENERRRFLVVGIDGPTDEQWEGLTEPEWDIDTYLEYNPKSESEFMTDTEGKGNYNEYLQQLRDQCLFPQMHSKQRRFQITLDDLSSMGVDIDRMLDPNIEYVPNVGTTHTNCFDKLNARKVKAVDKLRTIQPKEIV